MDADWCGGPDSEEIISEVVASHGNRDAIRTIRAVLQGNGQGNGQLIRDTLAAHVNTSLLLGTDGDPDCCRRAYEEEGGIAVNTPIAVGPCVAATPSRPDPPTHPPTITAIAHITHPQLITCSTAHTLACLPSATPNLGRGLGSCLEAAAVSIDRLA
jgi:hypothetical protein